MKKGYADAGFTADARVHRRHGRAYLGADLVLCRAGATTLAELTVCKKPSILVLPFPFATDDHQAVNAKALVDAGAAVMFREAELTGESSRPPSKELKGDPARLQKMEKAAGNLGRPEAAREIADVLQQLCLKKGALTGRSRGEPPARSLPAGEAAMTIASRFSLATPRACTSSASAASACRASPRCC